MSEVVKRDKRLRLLAQLYSVIKRDYDAATPASVGVWSAQLERDWDAFEALHDAVIDRAGVTEVEEQHKVYDDAHTFQYKSKMMLAELQQHFDMQVQDKKNASTSAGAAAAANAGGVIPRDVNVANQMQLRHATVIMRLETLCNQIVAEGDAVQPFLVDVQRKTIEQLFASFQEIGLERIANGAAQNDILAAEAVTTALYMNAAGILARVHQHAGGQGVNHRRDADVLAIPQLNIAAFDGQFEKWEGFRESFFHGIHARANMPAVQKLQFLKSVLRGEPEELLRNFALTAANYDSAWNLLNQRYNNRRELIICHLRVLTSMAPCSASADDLRKITNKTASTRMALTNLGRPTGEWDDWFVFHVCEKLDPETRRLWEQSLADDALPTWEQLDQFLQGRIRALSCVGSTPAAKQQTRQPAASSNKVRAHQSSANKQRESPAHSPVRQNICPYCSEGHLITFCEQFRRLSPNDRRRTAAEKMLCFVCLTAGHFAQYCNSTRFCQTCNAKHNTLLHSSEQASIEQQVRANTVAVSSNDTGRQRPPVLLATAVVNVRDSAGQLHPVRVLLDQGGDWSFVSTRLAQTLQLPRRREHGELSGIAGISAGRVKQSILLEVSDRLGNGFAIDVDAYVLPKVTSELRCIPGVDIKNWPHIAGLQLADPDVMNPQSVELVLGSEIYGKILLSGLRKADGYPTSQKTYFGWLMSGAIERRHVERGASSTAVNEIHTHHASIDAQLARFWEIEETSTKRHLTDEEIQCESFYENSVSRDDCGRLHVRLPMKHDVVVFGESQRFAVQRQLQIERRFITHPEFAAAYKQFMLQYVQLDHMREVPDATVDLSRSRAMLPPSKREYYIPHHAVVKEASTTTKLRVVFDASRRTTNGTSLNEQMLVGPRLQDDLTSIMMRWRTFRVAFCADVEKMYRQIVVNEPDTNLQRIVWRERADEPMKVYELCTVTYGTAAAPYLAIKSLVTLAQLERDRYPIGAHLAMNNFYVDDVLGGADTISECIEAQMQLQAVLRSGGMNLRKWASNSEEVLAMVNEADRECALPLSIDDGSNISTLGVQWSPGNDELCFKISMPTDDESPCTKRSFLSTAARLFDPLGWLAPCTIVIKILFQSLWKLHLDWDDELPSEMMEKWVEIRKSLHQLTAVRINRWIGTSIACDVELHGFCDASMDAYAAVVFVRVQESNQPAMVYNVCAKTKVAPLKVLSLPRLELCGAALLVKLISDVKAAMQWPAVDVRCWTDSTIVLAWLRGHPSTFNVFVANRTADIQRQVPCEQWQHVRSAENPADCASRGITPNQLLHHHLWWTGPAWLREERSMWPKQLPVPETTEETRTRSNNVTVATNGWDLIAKISSWSRLVRLTAYCVRFTRNCRSHIGKRMFGVLSTPELMNAREHWVRATQMLMYPDELRCLRNKTPISKSSKLRALNPILSPQNIMCVGGRLINAHEISMTMRTPAIVPRRTDLSALLIRDAHLKTMHGGPGLMLAYLRREFWIVDGPNEARQSVQRCTTCFRYAANPQQQLMGALPAARVVPSRPFRNCAMDYSGAIQVRSARGRGQHATKAYVAVFVCLATKAVHIELAGDLTTAGFIAAYERFTARRGRCTDLYSDNATNFVGAAKFLRSERERFNASVQTALSSMGTTWHFSPPVSPHFNGLAESAIRSIKHHIRRVIGESTLTFEELTTVLTKIEACLNSRPLCPMNNDPDNLDVLTPGHFLVGEPLITIPQRDLIESTPSALTRWQLTHQLVQRVWKRWSAEYLHTLQQRRKWQQESDNMRVGDMVLLVEDNLPPARWAIGRIVDVHPGDDGRVRVVTIRTRGSTFKRSVVKVARLPIDVQAVEVTEDDPADSV